MIKFGECFQLSATDLVGHLNCRHLTNLDVEVASGTLAKPKVWDPLLEIPIVFYSMATSSDAGAPRGMEFLYSLNRLNVATSRARCVCVLVSPPLLFEPECKTPRQMELANAFCRYQELAQLIHMAN